MTAPRPHTRHLRLDAHGWPCLLAIISLSLLIGCSSGQVKRKLDHRANVDFLWTSGKGRRVKQGTSPARIRLEPNDGKRIRIAVIEDQALQTGNMMRASVWIAATQAAMALNQDLSRWRVMVELDTSGMKVDGPSAGGLLTAALMAAMRGDRVDPTFTMTGTINPDGTIGPVGGIPHKIEAAAKKGKKVIGYPTGQRFSRNLRSGKFVDLHAVARHHKVKAMEVGDIYEAYQLLTGKTLARPNAVRSSAMELPEVVYKSIQSRTLAWVRAVGKNHASYKKMGIKSKWLDRMWTTVQGKSNRAVAFVKEGSTAAAYRAALQAFMDAESLLIFIKFKKAITQGGLAQERNLYKRWRPNVNNKIGRLYKKLKVIKPRSEHDLVTLVDAFESANEAIRELALADMAQRRALAILRTKKAKPTDAKSAQALRRQLHQPLHRLAVSNLQAGEAHNHLRFRDPNERGTAVNANLVERLVESLKGAASANLTYFEATVIAPAATMMQISEQSARARWKDKLYRSARLAPAVSKMNDKRLAKSHAARAVARLANALHVYHAGAALVAKHYSLMIRSKGNKLVSVGRKKAFTMMLEAAEHSAREHAAEVLSATGRVPVAAKVAYQTAHDLRDQTNLNDKFMALQYFWRSSLHSQLVVSLHRIHAQLAKQKAARAAKRK